MTVLLVVRRLHLYLGLFLLPWMVMFGISSYPINRPSPEALRWTRTLEIPFDAALPRTGGNLRPIGSAMMQAAGMRGRFYVSRPNPQQINVNHPNFLHPTRLIYDSSRRQLVAEGACGRSSRPCIRAAGSASAGSGTPFRSRRLRLYRGQALRTGH